MKYRNIFWGVILILLGILYLLKQLDVIWFNWRDILSLWPLILVLWGISLLPLKSMYKLIISLLAVGVMVLLIWTHPTRFHNNWLWIGHIDRTERTKELYDEDLSSEATEALLELDAAAGTYKVEGITDKLVDFKHIGDSGTYYMSTGNDGDRHHVRIGPESRRNQFSLYRSHEVEVKLNPGLTWDIDIDAGAADIEIDLRPFMIDEVTINGGAASMELILGDRSDNVNVRIETGVSSVLIKVPESVACEVNTESFLVSRELPGFDKVSKSTYVSPNFASAEKNIRIRFESGISSLRVLRY